MGAGGGDDELDDRVQGHRGGVDYQVVQGRVGRVAPVQAADVGGAGLVGRAQALSGLFLADAFDGGSLDDASLYHLVIDSTAIPLDTVVELILAAAHAQSIAAEGVTA